MFAEISRGKTDRGSLFNITANGREYEVRLYIRNNAMDSWSVERVTKNINCARSIMKEVEEELDKRNFALNNCNSFYFPLCGMEPDFSFSVSYYPPDFDRIDYDFSYDMPTRMFTIMERGNAEHSPIISFHTDPDSPKHAVFEFDITKEMQEIYGREKVEKVSIEYRVIDAIP